MNASRSKPIFHILIFFVLLASLLFSALGVTPAYAAGPIVTNTNDSGVGSLRQAIADAAVNDTITFDPGLFDEIIYLDSTLILTKNVTINGSGSALAISGDSVPPDGIGDGRVFVVNSGVFATLNGLIVTKGAIFGDDGGGIYNSGTLTITNSTLSNNSADNGGGIYNASVGTLTITNSTLFSNSATNDGGGIYTNGTLTVTNSTLSGNSATNASGGIHNNGELTVTGSTFSGNSAYYAGGIYNNNTLTVANSTFSGNFTSGSSGGAIYNAYNPLGGTATVTNSTFSGNAANYGGGITNDGTLTITNSTLSNNSATATGGGIYNVGTLNYANTIIANSSLGGDCADGGGTIGTNTNNLVEDASCSASLSSDPNLGALAANGGFTQTFALLVGSIAINAGNDTICATDPVNNLDQRAALRPNGAHCDIGSYEADFTAPTVVSSDLVNASTTNLTSVQFTVTFSESVTGVDVGDFSLTSTVTGASVTSVSADTGTTRTVTVNTGSGNGSIRLDVLDDNSIHDAAGNPLNGAFSSGNTYTIDKTVTLTVQSTGTQDGWVLESSEISGKGGTINANTPTFTLGDDSTKKQYLGILSFSTGAGLPDTAVITGVTLKVMKKSIVGGGNPVATFKGFMVDIKNGIFGTAALQAADFQTKASHSYGPFMAVPVSNWYSINLTGGSTFINKLASGSGLTQIRLRFKLDDNNNAIANYLALYSGNAPTADRPQLVISYYVP